MICLEIKMQERGGGLNKKVIRKDVLQQLHAMDLNEYRQYSEDVTKAVTKLKAYQQAKTIGITISRFPEVDTIPLIKAAWADGKQVAVPRCIQSTREMDFRQLTSFDELETVYMDLQEPIVDQTITIEQADIDLQIVPGVVYSLEGYRIGFGGGYYDRYLSTFKGKTISLAFSCQLKENVPFEQHDVPVQLIITEAEKINTGKK